MIVLEINLLRQSVEKFVMEWVATYQDKKQEISLAIDTIHSDLDELVVVNLVSRLCSLYQVSVRILNTDIVNSPALRRKSIENRTETDDKFTVPRFLLHIKYI
jgi:hypothetical protein